jgi:hypothetical protein
MGTDQDAARQAKIDRMVAAVDADRAAHRGTWAEYTTRLHALPVAARYAWLRLAAENAGTRRPSDETCALALLRLDTLAEHETDPFAGLPNFTVVTG